MAEPNTRRMLWQPITDLCLRQSWILYQLHLAVESRLDMLACFRLSLASVLAAFASSHFLARFLACSFFFPFAFTFPPFCFCFLPYCHSSSVCVLLLPGFSSFISLLNFFDSIFVLMFLFSFFCVSSYRFFFNFLLLAFFGFFCLLSFVSYSVFHSFFLSTFPFYACFPDMPLRLLS
jgi:hypothetical protein